MSKKLIGNNDSKKTLPLWFEVACIEDNKLWFIAGIGNGLFEMDLISGEIILLEMLPNESYDVRRLMGSIIKEENKLIMAPYNGEYFHEYDLDKKKFTSFSCKIKGDRKFFCAKRQGENIYYIGCKEPVIVKYNIINQKLEYILKVEDNLLKRRRLKDDNYFRETAIIKNNKLIIPSCQANFVLEFNLVTNEYKTIDIDNNNDGFNTILESEKGCILISRRSKKILLWNDINNEVEELLDLSKEEYNEFKIFGYSVKFKDKIITFDLFSPNGFIIDEKDRKIKPLDNVINIDIKAIKADKFMDVLWVNIIKNKIYFLSTYGSVLYELDLITLERKEHRIEIKNCEFAKYSKLVLKNKIIFDEGIDHLGIDYILNTFDLGESKELEKSEIGNKVHKVVKELI